MAFNARDVMDGRIEYYIETATDQTAQDMQAFALELLATTMLDLNTVQNAIDSLEAKQGDDLYEDAVADAVTHLVLAKVHEIKEALNLLPEGQESD